MPTYEAIILIRALTKPELVPVLKRVSTVILNKNGILRSIDNLGRLPTPYKISSKGLVHRQANYFMFTFDSSYKTLYDLKEEYNRDVDIIRQSFFKIKDEPQKFDCKIDEEMQPPAYRPDVQEMIKKGKKQQNPFTQVFKYNSGLTYYPFQK